jgi:AcrR family transcriptional regulator
MPQFKKEKLRSAILKAATQLFTAKGYANTTIGEIAKKSGMAQGNIYNYFDSKFDIFITIFRPWFESKLDNLEHRLGPVHSPRARLREVLFALWRDIPESDNGFHNNLMQALVTKKPEEQYSRAHLYKMEARLASLIRPALPAGGRNILRDNLFLHLAFMASDGFSITHKLIGATEDVSRIVNMTCDLLLSEPARKSPRTPAANRRRRLNSAKSGRPEDEAAAVRRMPPS